MFYLLFGWFKGYLVINFIISFINWFIFLVESFFVFFEYEFKNSDYLLFIVIVKLLGIYVIGVKGLIEW